MQSVECSHPIESEAPALENHRPIRILHVVGGMSQGGIQAWLVNVLRNIDRDRFQMDFLVHTDQPCVYDEEILNLGSKIIPCPLNRFQLLSYAAKFKQILKAYGPYDVVHSHVHHFSGYVLRLAQHSGVPIRIAHSHTDTSLIEAKAKWYRRFYLALMKACIARYATIGLGCSHEATVNLFNSAWNNNFHQQVLYCGIDLNPFKVHINSIAIRSEFGIPEDAFVIGHVGRFDLPKNHAFLLDIAAEIAKQEPKMRFLLVGTGTLRSDIERKVEELCLTNHVIFAGARSDVPRLMLGAMDAFLLPSLYEGLALVLVEAQAAGLPCIISDVVPEEAEVVKPLMQRVSLSQPASAWAIRVLATRNIKANVMLNDHLTFLGNSEFNLKNSIRNLTEIYEYKGY